MVKIHFFRKLFLQFFPLLFPTRVFVFSKCFEEITNKNNKEVRAFLLSLKLAKLPYTLLFSMEES
jgi:hypothetical protein